MLKETLKDTGHSVQTILTKPLLIPGLPKEISLLSAAKKFNPNDPATSDLKKLVDALKEYASATDILIKELQLLSEDLRYAS